MAVVRWTFMDPTDSSTYEFDLNPSEGGSPTYQKTVTYSNTAGQGGRVLMFEGRDAVKQFTVSGTILREAHYNAMITWFSKRHSLILTDDLGRDFPIYITGFTATRKRSALYPYKHSYTLTYTELDW